MTKSKKIKNEKYSDSFLFWVSYYFTHWYDFALLLLLVLGVTTFIVGKVTIIATLFFSVLTWGLTQLFNLFIIIAFQAPLIQFIVIDYQNKSLIITYKYPFGKIKIKTLNHNSFSLRVWKNRHHSFTTIKSEDFKITIRDGQFGLDLLDLWKLNTELAKIGNRYRSFFDF